MRRGLVPYGTGSTRNHVRGCLAEQAAAIYLGVDLPEDWTLEGDKKRGHDVGGWNVRSSFYGDKFLWRNDRDYQGAYIFAATYDSPVIWLMGHLYSTECRKVAVPGTIGDRACHYINVADLWQLPDWGIQEVCAA